MNTIFVLLCAFVAFARSETERVPWKGPFADNKPGVLVEDTADVAAAKVSHFLAHKEARAILPQLSDEEIFPKGAVHPQFQSTTPVVMSLSALGEVDAVAKAREAHLKAVEDARASLPMLVEQPRMTEQVVVTQGFLVDTEEVKEAKRAHARAVAAALGL